MKQLWLSSVRTWTFYARQVTWLVTARIQALQPTTQGFAATAISQATLLPTAQTRRACDNCGKPRHLASDCSNETVCNTCNLSGHVARQCTKSIRPHVACDCWSSVMCKKRSGRGQTSLWVPFWKDAVVIDCRTSGTQLPKQGSLIMQFFHFERLALVQSKFGWRQFWSCLMWIVLFISLLVNYSYKQWVQ